MTPTRHLPDVYRSQEFTDAMWWAQRWISGSINDPDWDEGEACNSLTIDGAFELLRQVVGGEGSATTLWRYLTVNAAELERMHREKVLFPGFAPFQSFTTSHSLVNEIAEEFHIERAGMTGVLISCEPPPDLIVFSLQRFLEIPAAREHTRGLEDWFWQDEVLVRVVEPLPIKDLLVMEEAPTYGM